MKSMHGKIQSFLIIAISFWVGMDPIYRQSNNLSEIDFFSPIPVFEILDLEDLLADERKQELKILTLNFSCPAQILSLNCLVQSLTLSFQGLSCDRPLSVLRC